MFHATLTKICRVLNSWFAPTACRKRAATTDIASSVALEIRQLFSATGTAPAEYNFGLPGDTFLSGNWNGQGSTAVVVRQPGVNGAPADGLVHWYFTDGNLNVVNQAAFGLAGDSPVVGDWDGDGNDEIGVTRKSGGAGVANDGLLNWFLKSSSSSTGYVERKYGFSSDTPVVGNWDGEGGDDLGVVRVDAQGFQNWLQDWTGDSMPERSFVFGLQGDKPIVEDWDNDGTDNAGVTRSAGGTSLNLLMDTNNDPSPEITRSLDAASQSTSTRTLSSSSLARGVVMSSIDLRLPQIDTRLDGPIAISYALSGTSSPIVFIQSPLRTPIVLQSEGSSFAHQVGRKDGDGWSVNVKDTANRFLSYGPSTTAVPAGIRTATFRLQLDNVTADNSRILTIDVFDATTGKVIAKREIRRKDFSKAYQYQNFTLNFNSVAGHRLEFRTYWHGGSYVKQDKVTIR